MLLQQLVYDSNSPLIFNSGFFVFMFLFFTLLYYTLRHKNTTRILFVTLFSYYFYYKSSGTHFFILAVVTLCDFLIARQIERGAKKLWLVLSLLVDLGLLAFFKYTNFFIDIYNSIFSQSAKPYAHLDILLPVGISFYIFQSLSYIIDVYRGNIKPLKSLLDYAFYVSFFPQLVAGPIVRARDFIPQIRRQLSVTREMFSVGLFLIISGLIKKAIISDYISLNFVDRIFDQPSLYSGLENLLGIYGYTLQIYCDFSGYSDMAIGIALLLGFHFPKNFDSPYKSRSITEFWRRWHISLSSWLRDYLYISMGGNRKGKIRTYFNLMITMLLGGLWHGASWNFILWGALHGVCLTIERLCKPRAMKPASIAEVQPNEETKSQRLFGIGRKKNKENSINHYGFSILNVLRTILTFNLVAFIWLFFRNKDLGNSILMIERIFTDFKPQLFMQVVNGYAAVMILIAIGYIMHFTPSRWVDGLKHQFSRLYLPFQAIIIILIIWIVIQIKSSDIQPFIYFQF